MARAPNQNPPGTTEHKTRSKIIAAAIECIAIQGYQHASTNRIAQHAGLTWGVIQYHFGDKDGLMKAVLDSIFSNYPLLIAEVAQLSADFDNRKSMKALIDMIWEEFRTDRYRASMEIIKNIERDPAIHLNADMYLEEWSVLIGKAWTSLFPDAAHSEQAKRILFASLQGFAESPIASTDRNYYSSELDCLAEAITHIIETPP